MKAILISAMLLGISFQQCQAADDKDFNRFVEGALTVYSQFKKPSKAESERFYDFVQAKWSKADCKHDCSDVGYAIGQQYAKEKNIEIKPKSSLQPSKRSI
ncbi:lysis inhibition regulator [Acinetobacter phage vB_AbaM_PhT2]|uniref:Lysis inhibition regulator n=2 Tax=Hadassahvirus TaxID=2842716 RepID=A0A6B9SY34_9CAUD|nr:lysis inhibition [Acinetobacter phage AbTZA1]YP_009887217.1 lysis inhibition [Acinetobacter phage vB_AbaM_PhT2]QQM13869.1 rI lysis inhibition regulator [Acinetobacter phage Maestro]QQM18625.1 rI lysis inhibition regulator [Acinetobacter phage Morttis]QQO96332.1 antiholin rI [Acinetobacter phage Minot]QQO96580.1 antiholin rI [Acinetobacter phage Mokit]QQO96835.1 rI lysis inhibition regulator [Acinetobacter phage Melin]UQS94208.1 rI lysis inhibition regulator [Acinetobacter phage AB-Navy71]